VQKGQAVRSLDTLFAVSNSAQTAQLPGRARRSPTTLVLGRYRLLSRLGAGGFGVVWRAHDELLDREVAVKRIALAPDGDTQRAQREALATSRLGHPAIVALLQAGPEGDSFYIVSELVVGQTLAALIRTDAVDDREILDIGIALSDALIHAHGRGVVHRDVKPHNVLVPDHPTEPAGVAKLADFGGARLAGEQALTLTGDVLGTLAYMAPEQAAGRAAGPSADLYALALVLYEAFSGENPVRGPTVAATARRVGTALPSLGTLRRDLPGALIAAVDRAVAVSPAARGGVSDLRAGLVAALEQGAGTRRWRRGARPRPQTDEATRRAMPKPPQRVAGAIGAAALIAAALAGLGPAPATRSVALACAVGAVAVALLPRLGWLAAATAIAIRLVIEGRPGAALVVFAAAAPVTLLRRPGPAWTAPALAPLLGLAGLAGAFPAIAGQGQRPLRRALVGALGYWWLTLGAAVLGRRLWLAPSAQALPRSAWQGSLTAAWSHALAPLLTPALLTGCALWAGAAAVLPWLLRGRRAIVDVLAAGLWAVALMVLSSLLGVDGGGEPRGLLLGTLTGATVAVAVRALRGVP
jgi:hypothetical protein